MKGRASPFFSVPEGARLVGHDQCLVRSTQESAGGLFLPDRPAISDGIEMLSLWKCELSPLGRWSGYRQSDTDSFSPAMGWRRVPIRRSIMHRQDRRYADLPDLGPSPRARAVPPRSLM